MCHSAVGDRAFPGFVPMEQPTIKRHLVDVIDSFQAAPQNSSSDVLVQTLPDDSPVIILCRA